MRFIAWENNSVRVGRRDQGKVEIYRELEDLAEEMNYVVDAVLVEGPHDRKTLRALGSRMPIILSSGRLSHDELVESLADRFSRIAILTDFDDEGEKTSKKLTDLIERRGIKVDRFYRSTFRKLLRKIGLTTLESIYGLKKEIFT